MKIKLIEEATLEMLVESINEFGCKYKIVNIEYMHISCLVSALIQYEDLHIRNRTDSLYEKVIGQAVQTLNNEDWTEDVIHRVHMMLANLL